MKKDIRIFIAGAKALKHERNALKALAHDLNTHYEDRHVGIHLKIKSYEDFMDNQNEYNDYIENFADVVIFVLKDSIGKYTKEEFIRAADAFGRKKRPEIIVFLNKDRQGTAVEEEIQTLMQDHLGNYYFVEYTDEENLKVEARKRIDRYVRPTFQKNSTATKWMITSLLGSTLLFAGLFVWSYFSTKPKVEENPRLEAKVEAPSILFAGGGSVINCIQDSTCSGDTTGKFLINYPNSLCVYMPSSLAWKLLAEEINRYDYQKKKVNYRTICLSADSIPCDPDKIQKMVGSCSLDDIRPKARLMECFLDDDPLVVYIDNNFFKIGDNRSFLDKHPNLKDEMLQPNANYREFGEISTELLTAIIKQRRAHFFSTSATSGTALVYERNLCDTTIKFEELFKNSEYNRISVYTEQKGIGEMSKKSPWILLGSEFYNFKFDDKAPGFNEESFSKYYLVNKNGDRIKKKMFLYFVAFKDEEKECLVIADEVYDFLNKIHPKGNPDWHTKVNDIGHTYNWDAKTKDNSGGIIVPLIEPKSK